MVIDVSFPYWFQRWGRIIWFVWFFLKKWEEKAVLNQMCVVEKGRKQTLFWSCNCFEISEELFFHNRPFDGFAGQPTGNHRQLNANHPGRRELRQVQSKTDWLANLCVWFWGQNYSALFDCFFFKNFVRPRSILWSHWLLLFWTLCDLPPGFQIQSESLTCTLSCIAWIEQITFYTFHRYILGFLGPFKAVWIWSRHKQFIMLNFVNSWRKSRT